MEFVSLVIFGVMLVIWIVLPGRKTEAAS